ncbi:MAG: tRNA pseudouridine(54/55) synthase Pus10 [Candidatus Aenigmarchaeota archaeon]|nr:tRNA pseudouridine(54/55) synthase Pus10 [Candidatus Aenigmarchaeota archaeon]
MEIYRAAKTLLKGPICDHCLGRQFAALLTGMANEERGRAIRLTLAMEYEAKPFKLDVDNFHGIGLRKSLKTKGKECRVCNNIFAKLAGLAGQAAGQLKGVEFATFLVGTKLSGTLVAKEESLWEETGINHCESIRAEINRVVGKLLEKQLGKKFSRDNPEVNVTLDLELMKAQVSVMPLFVYGKYKKLVRGIPQTKWDKYQETVEDVIAGPFMPASKGKGHAMHAAGREDIDARCLDYRPFVFQVDQPQKRSLDLAKLAKLVNQSGKVEVSQLRRSDRAEVRKVKKLRPDKTYRLLVSFAKPVTGLAALAKLKGTISQKTPTRVMHRRADLLRKRKVKGIKVRKLAGNRIEVEVRCEAGLYAKELMTGDNGRTKPSAAELLGNPAKVEELDVIKIWLK